jgi:hypothetical protein
MVIQAQNNGISGGWVRTYGLHGEVERARNSLKDKIIDVCLSQILRTMERSKLTSAFEILIRLNRIAERTDALRHNVRKLYKKYSITLWDRLK